MLKKIKGYGNYLVSKNGEIFSIKKNGIKELTGSMTSYKKNNIGDAVGYRVVSLCKDGTIKRILVHRIVALHFVDNDDNKPFVNHIDGNKLNNCYENLEWCTHQENMSHASDNGFFPNRKKWNKSSLEKRIKNYEKNPNSKRGRSKLSRNDVIEIRKCYQNGESATSISKRYPVNRVACSRVGKRETYRHIDCREESLWETQKRIL